MCFLRSPFVITLIIFGFATISSILAVLGNRAFRSTLWGSWPVLLPLLALSLLIRLPIGEPFFHGLEYEDCYVHQAAARQLRVEPTSYPESGAFRESTYSIGSIESGDAPQIFYGFIGYPSVIALLQRILGDEPYVGHTVSLLASCICTALVFLLAAQISGDRRAPTVVAFAYTCIPIGNAFAATTSAEVLSSLYVTTCLVLVYALARSRTLLGRCAVHLALSGVLTFSVLVKRENLILLLLFPVLYHLVTQPSPGAKWRRLLDTMWRSALVILLPLGFLCLMLGLSAYTDERDAIASSPFTLQNFVVLAPVFARSFCSLEYYLIFGVALLYVPLAWFRLPRVRPLVVLFLGYLLAYSTHFRSYYFLETFQASSFDTIRWMMNIMPLFATLSGICLLVARESLWGARCFRSSASRTLVSLAGLLGLLAAAALTAHSRSEFTREEQQFRIQPVVESLKFLEERHGRDFWVFTFEPCVWQVYAPRWFKLVDSTAVGSYDERVLDEIVGEGHAYAFLTSFDLSDAASDRFRKQLAWLRARESATVFESRYGRLVSLMPPAREAGLGR